MAKKISCEQCKYFTQHYFAVSGVFFKARCEQCENIHVPKSYGERCIREERVCNLWEEKETED